MHSAVQYVEPTLGQAEIALRLFHDFAGPSAAMSAEGLAKVHDALPLCTLCPMLCLSVLHTVFSRYSVSVTVRLVAAVSLCVRDSPSATVCAGIDLQLGFVLCVFGIAVQRGGMSAWSGATSL